MTIDHRWEQLAIIWAGAATLQGVLYLIPRRTKNATAVDAGWGLSVAAAAVFCALTGPGAAVQRVLIGVLGGFENARVGFVVIRRLGHGEDGRYADLRAAGSGRAANSSPSRSSTRPRPPSGRDERVRALVSAGVSS